MRFVIVGAGIAGLSTAWAAAKRGHEVVLIEQATIPNPLSASGDHHRIIRRAYAADTGYGAAITEAHAAWDELWGDLGPRHYDPRGFLCLSREPGDEAERYREGLDAGGFSYKALSPAEAASRWPFLEPEALRWAIVSGEGGALHCRAIAAGMAEWLRRAGAEVRESCTAVAVDEAEGVVTLADGECIAGDMVVVTAGAWVLRLLPDLDATLSSHRTAVVYLEPPAEFAAAWADAPVMLDVGGDTDGYIIPPSGGGGLKFGSGLHRNPTRDPDADRAPRPGEGEAIRDLFAAPFRRIGDYRVRGVSSCVYTFTADERFFCRWKGRCLVVSACSGHGYKFGAAVGRRVARAIETRDENGLRTWLEGRAA